MQEAFMRRALEIAARSLAEPGALPYGAVVVRDGRIVGEGLNRAHALCDPTSHGEIEAVRAACRSLGTLDLSGCDVYTSCEPCAMCVATLYMAGIERLYFSATLEDSKDLLGQLAARDPKWARKISSDALWREMALPAASRRLAGQQVMPSQGRTLLESFVRQQI
jgi:guanine deaminase